MVRAEGDDGPVQHRQPDRGIRGVAMLASGAGCTVALLAAASQQAIIVHVEKFISVGHEAAVSEENA